MSTRKLAVVAIGLWALTLIGAGVIFVRGKTAPASDGRRAVLLTPAERDLVLGEMRSMLTAVHGVVAGLSAKDMKQVSSAARAGGMGMAVDDDPVFLAKLPLDFKRLGMQAHDEFDKMAEAADSGADGEVVLERLSQQLTRCIACHSAYRLEASPES